MTDQAIDTLKVNLEWATKKMIQNPKDSEWLSEKIQGKLFVEKRYEVEDFALELPVDANDKETDINNSILLFERLKKLPKYVLTDERFWAWMNFQKGYEVALKYMPIKEGSSVLKDHWLFSSGQRRGLFFGVLSRCFFRVEFTYDESLADPYELTRFAISNPERFRNLTWRTFSNDKKIVHACLKAERDVLESTGVAENNDIYPEIAKYISKLGSVMLLDAMSTEDIYQRVYEEFEAMVKASA